MSKINPYTKRKSKLVAQFILEGKTNEDIYAFIKENNLDKDFKKPVTKRTISNVRWQMKSEGHLGEDGFPLNEDDLKSRSTLIKKENNGNGDNEEDPKKPDGNNEDPDKDSKKKTWVQRRQDWDLLTIKQINEIADLKLRQEILDYKTFWAQARQQATPDYATKEQFDGFKVEINESLGIIMKTLNKMQIDNPTKPEVEVAGVDDVILPSMDLETENPLEATADSVIELAGSIISQKKIGFTSKSLLLFDLVRKKGFKGNLADFVNSSITSAMKGRKFKLVVEEDVE